MLPATLICDVHATVESSPQWECWVSAFLGVFHFFRPWLQATWCGRLLMRTMGRSDGNFDRPFAVAFVFARPAVQSSALRSRQADVGVACGGRGSRDLPPLCAHAWTEINALPALFDPT